MVFYIGAQDGLKTLAKWPKDPGIFSIYRSIDRGYLQGTPSLSTIWAVQSGQQGTRNGSSSSNR